MSVYSCSNLPELVPVVDLIEPFERNPYKDYILKGSWDLVTRVIIRVTILITPSKILITLLTKSHDPPSSLPSKADQLHLSAHIWTMLGSR